MDIQTRSLEPAGIPLIADSFMQRAYVTNDMEQAQAVFRDFYGLTEFLELPELAIRTSAGNDCLCSVSLVQQGNVQLEIIKPLGGNDGTYRNSLGDEGEFSLVYHHESLKAPSLDRYREVRSIMMDKGFELVFDGEHPYSFYFYADTRALLGHYWEYQWFTPEGEAFMSANVPVFQA